MQPPLGQCVPPISLRCCARAPRGRRRGRDREVRRRADPWRYGCSPAARVCWRCTQGGRVDHSDVVAVLDDLEQLSLVKRAADPAGRRRNIVSITRAGSKRLRQLHDVIADVQSQLLAPLSATDREQFTRMLRQVIDG
jgi:MarR family transcriptional regulator, lower aerobic nicotinate degradation pathway regulator